LIYLDNAATCWPKPPAVVEAMAHFLNEIGANPGRSGHRRSVEAGRVVYQAREALAALFGLADPLRLVFTPNATYALNLALRGLLRPGDHVITSSMEHNAVMRPLRAVEQEGVDLSVVQCSYEGTLEIENVRRALRPETKLMVLNHASNVCGTLLPVADVGRIARQAGLLLLVDAAQTAGAVPIDVGEMDVDLLAFTGHKGLLGPTGTGGLVIGDRVPLERFEPLVRGGTGSRSEHETQPDFLPDRFESGTLNAVGLAGLLAGVRYVTTAGVEAIRAQELELTQRLRGGLQTIPGVTVYGPGDTSQQVAVVSFNLAGRTTSQVAQHLDEVHDIACRPGLHCAPAAHRTLGTFPGGTVRLSLGPFNSTVEVDQAIQAIAGLAQAR
jgi:cysteine desulfurase/selenocysteine lyase